MKLPNYKNAVVAEAKITLYLLSDENSGGKAAFFSNVGFSLEQWEILRTALLDHAAVHEVARLKHNMHGMKYIIDGKLSTPDGRNPQVRSVWIVENGQTVARFVTAYPLEGVFDD